MFEFVRSHTRLLQLLLLVLILPSFVVFGIQGYSSFNEGDAQKVAKVDGQAISQTEWDEAHRRQVDQMRQRAPNVDAKLFDSPEARSQTLESLVRDRVMQHAAQQLNLSISNEQLQRQFLGDPQFEMLRNPDGSINKQVLAMQGMSSEAFAQRLRLDLSAQQVTRGLLSSSVAPVAVVNSTLDALLQQREIHYARFDIAAYLAKVTPTDADIEAYYKSHVADFRAPEQASIEYVVLDVDAIKQGEKVSEDELRKYYTENAQRYTAAEERRARHLLVKADKDAAADVKQKAKAKAEQLLADVRKNPDGFAELAKKNSDDPGSAAQGGDLGFFGRGAMTKPFEDAVFAMKPGEISNVIETDFGYHIIKLEATRGGEKKPFEAVRAQIEDEARKQQAQKRWADAVDQFTNTLFEQYESLQPVIDKLKLEKKTATVQRTPAAGAAGPLASAKLLEAVFANDVVKNKRNTAAVEVGPQQMAAARIVKHEPAHDLPLADVKERVRTLVQAEQAAALARKDGAARLAQLRKDGAGELPGSATVSRARVEGLPRQALEAVLKADASKLPTYLSADIPGQGFFVARIDKVLPREVMPGDAQLLQNQYNQVWAQAEAQAYYQALRKRYKVEQHAAAASAAGAAATR